MPEDALLKETVVARKLGVNVTTLYRWRKRKIGPPFYNIAPAESKVPMIRYRESEIIRYLAEHREEAH